MDARALVLVLVVGCGDAALQPDAPFDASGDALDRGPPPTPPDGLVAWIAFGGSAVTGHLYEVVWGGPFHSAVGPGYRGKGTTMDGERQYALVDTTQHLGSRLNFAGAFTLAAWVRADRMPTEFETVLSRSYGVADESSFALVIDSSMRVRYDSQGGSSVTSDHSVPVGTWTHIASTFDGSAKRVFINGVLAGSGDSNIPVEWDHRYIIMGADEGMSEFKATHHLLGIIDEVMFFERALSEAEIASIAK